MKHVSRSYYDIIITGCDNMVVRNNYNECLTNLACSIRKYFGLDYKHNTLDYIDKILEENKPKNVVTILCDGMGSRSRFVFNKK